MYLEVTPMDNQLSKKIKLSLKGIKNKIKMEMITPIFLKVQIKCHS